MHTPGLGVVWDSKHDDVHPPTTWVGSSCSPTTKTSLHCNQFTGVSFSFLSAGSQVSTIFLCCHFSRFSSFVLDFLLLHASLHHNISLLCYGGGLIIARGHASSDWSAFICPACLVWVCWLLGLFHVCCQFPCSLQVLVALWVVCLCIFGVVFWVVSISGFVCLRVLGCGLRGWLCRAWGGSLGCQYVTLFIVVFCVLHLCWAL